MTLKKERFTGLAGLAAKSGQLDNPRERLLSQLVKELRDITVQLSSIDDEKKPRKVQNEGDLISRLKQRNSTLEMVVANLDAKAISIAKEYADFFDETVFERSISLAESQRYFEDSEEFKIANIQTQKAEAKLERLQNDVVQGVNAQTKVAEETLIAYEENRRLREVTISLHERLSYRGPKFSEIKAAFLADRLAKGISTKLIDDFAVKIGLFIDLKGDKEISNYSVSSLQEFATKLCSLPQRHSVMPQWRGMRIIDIIELNEKKRLKNCQYLAESTIRNNFVGRIRTVMRWACAEHKVPNPFQENLRYQVNQARRSVMRHGFTYEQVNLLLSKSSIAKKADERWLPFVALLTGARIGELVMLSPEEIEQRNGTWVMDFTRQEQHRRDVSKSVKTETSRRYVVLHDALVQRGFVRWATDGDRSHVFMDFQGAANPAGAASKRFQRLFKIWGLTNQNVEVFHALRHTYKDLARAARVDERSIALQTGHSLDGVAMNYGSKILRPDEMAILSKIPLISDWRLDLYDEVYARIQRDDPRSKYKKRYRKLDLSWRG